MDSPDYIQFLRFEQKKILLIKIIYLIINFWGVFFIAIKQRQSKKDEWIMN